MKAGQAQLIEGQFSRGKETKEGLQHLVTCSCFDHSRFLIPILFLHIFAEVSFFMEMHASQLLELIEVASYIRVCTSWAKL